MSQGSSQQAEIEVRVKEKPGTVSKPIRIKIRPRFEVFVYPESAETDVGGSMTFGIKFKPKPKDYDGLVQMWLRGLPPGVDHEFEQNPIHMSAEGKLVISAPEEGPVGEWRLSLACREVPSIDPPV